MDEEDADDDVVTITIEGRRIGDLYANVDGANPARWGSRAFNQGTLVLTGLNKSLITVTLTDSWTGESFPPIFVYRVAPRKKKQNPPNNQNGNGPDNR